MVELPYGIADFRRIRQQGMVYVDRTAYLRAIELLGSALVFLGPRRRLGEDRGAVASLLYFMGLLTLTGTPGRLRIPNLVVKKLFLDRLLEIYLPEPRDSYAAREIALRFFQDGDLSPLLAFFEDKLLPVLCLLVRPEMRRYGFFDFLFELKLVRRKELGRSGQELREMEAAELRRLPPVAQAFEEGHEQARRYAAALTRQRGEELALRTYVVVAVDVERVLGEEVGGGDQA